MTINKYKDLHLKKFNFNEGEHNIRDYSKIHNIHKFYAKLIPQIPRFLINKYSKPGELVLDPFCGSGTTLLEAKILKRNSVGVDINPLAVLISEVKVKRYDLKKLEYAIELVKETILKQDIKLRTEFLNIEHWFSKKARNDLDKIKSNIEDIKNEISHKSFKFLLVCFSSIIRRSSFADNTISKIYKSKRVIRKFEEGWRPEPINYYLENMDFYFQKINEFNKVINKNTNSVEVLCGNVKKISELLVKNNFNSVDLIITSPPYINAQNYIRTYKLELYWLGLAIDSNLKKLREEVIGNEITTENNLKEKPNSKVQSLNSLLFKIWKKNKKRAYIILNYFKNMELVIQSLFKILKKEGYICVIIGNNTICGYQIPSNLILIKLFNINGFKLIEIFEDKIKRRSLNPNRNHNGGSIDKEWIIVFKKQNFLQI